MWALLYCIIIVFLRLITTNGNLFMRLHTKGASVYPLYPVAFQKVVKRHSLNEEQKFLIDAIRGTQMCSTKSKTTSCTHLFKCSLEILFSRLSKTLM